MQPTLPLVLSAKRLSWRVADDHATEADMAFQKIRETVLERDEYACRFCGFFSPKWQEVSHLDDNHRNNAMSNLATACCFCHKFFHLGSVGACHAGIMVWLPEISQANLHHLCRAIFVTKSAGRKHAEFAEKMYGFLENCSEPLEEEFGSAIINPASIGQILLRMSDAQYAKRAERFAPVRLLPRPQPFLQQIQFWASNQQVFGSIDDEHWDRIVPEGALDAIMEGA